VNAQLSLTGIEDCFALPPGFVYAPSFLQDEEQRRLVSLLESWSFAPVFMRGVVARRSALHFGVSYNLQTNEVETGQPWPKSLDWLRQRAGKLAGVDPADLRQALVMKYPVGAPIGWHRDRPMFGPKVIGISLRASCKMRFRKGNVRDWQTAELDLTPGSAYVIGGEARSVWEHHIPPTRDLRYSVTFRTLRNV
jgi:alkylated DNA repair protein (DNA oxidative demethylase)